MSLARTSIVGSLALAVIGCISGCKKNDQATGAQLEGSFRSEATVMVNDPVMYTRNGLITDAAKIKAFLERRKVSTSFTFGKATENQQEGQYRIVSKGDGRFEITTPLRGDRSFPAERKNTTEPEWIIRAIKSDTIPHMGGSQPYSAPVQVYKYGFTDSYIIPLPSSSGYSGLEVANSWMILREKDGEFYIPLLTLCQSYPQGFWSLTGEGMNTVPKPSPASLLTAAEDTVVLQLKSVHLKKVGTR